MDQARQVSASFVQGRPLTVSIAEPYYGSVTYSRPNSCLGVDGRYLCKVSAPLGGAITVTATPTDQGRFVGWDGACTGNAATCTVTMSDAASLTASFELSPRLAVTKPGTGSGTVTAAGTTLSCGSTCIVGTAPRATVVLTATAAAGSRLTRWAGACDSVTAATCTVTMDTGKSVQALFEKSADTFRAPPSALRAYDTRAGQRGVAEARFDQDTPIAPSTIQFIDLLPVVSAPAGSTFAVNVTVVGPAGAGSLKLFGCTFVVNPFANPTFMSFAKGPSQSTSGVVTIGSGQQLCLMSTATTHVLVDVTGWYPPGQTYARLSSSPRLLDSRAGVRGALETTDLATPFANGTVRRFTPLGKAGIGTTGVAALQLNVTVVSPTSNGQATMYPCSATTTAAPQVATLTFTKGVSTSTAAVVTIGAAGGFCVRTTGGTHLVVSASGWMRSGRGYVTFSPSTQPRRLFDSRPKVRGVLEPTDATTTLSPNSVRRLVVAGQGGFPASTGVGAVAITLTVIGPAASGSVKAWPCTAAASPPPTASALTFVGGRTTSAGTVVAVSSNGGICMSSSATTHLVVDGVGWFKR